MGNLRLTRKEKGKEIKTMKLWIKISLCLVLWILAGCASVEQNWETAQLRNTVQAYRGFLTKHPQSEYSLVAEQRIEEISWKEVEGHDSLDGYKQFLEENPDSKYANIARRRISEKIEDNNWQRAKSIDTIVAYEQFLKGFPKSKYVEMARRELQEKTEERSWQKTKQADTIAAYELFLREFPKSRYVEMARNELRKKEESHWQKTKQADTIAAYEQFLKNNPKSRYVETARSELQKKIEERDTKRRRYELEYEDTKKKRTIAACQEFLNKYPDNMEIKQLMEDLLIEEIEKNGVGKERIRFPDILPLAGHHSGRMTLQGRISAVNRGYAADVKPVKLFPKDMAVFSINTVSGYGMLPGGSGSVWCFVGRVAGMGRISQYCFEGDESDPLTFLLLDKTGLVYLHGNGRVIQGEKEIRMGEEYHPQSRYVPESVNKVEENSSAKELADKSARLINDRRFYEAREVLRRLVLWMPPGWTHSIPNIDPTNMEPGSELQKYFWNMDEFLAFILWIE